MKQFKAIPLFLLGAVTLLLLSGCASPGKESTPRWLDTLYDKQYSEDLYLCAVGSGSSREKASDAALASLSQVFNAQVRSVTTVLSRSTAQDDGTGELKFTELSEMVDQGSVSSVTDKIVGTEVVNTYIDDNARVYVRIALNRKKTAALYQKEINELDLSIMTVRRSMMAVSEPLERYFILRKALSFAHRQQNLYDQMQVLVKMGQSSTLIPLERELAGLASSVKIAIAVDSLGDHDVLFSAFAQSLGSLGFAVVPLDGNPTAFLELQYRCTPLELENSPYKYARYTLSAQLNSSRATLFSYQKNEREAAMSIAEAEKKALIQATTGSLLEFFTLLQERLGDTK